MGKRSKSYWVSEWTKQDAKLLTATERSQLREAEQLISAAAAAAISASKKQKQPSTPTLNPTKLSPNKGTSAFHIACTKGLVDFLRLFLTLDIDIDMKDLKGRTPLHCALRAAQYQIIDLLLQNGSSVLAVDHEYFSVLHQACYGCHIGCVQLLLQAHSPVYLKDKFGRCPLAYAAGRGQASICRLLLDAGAEIDNVGNNKITPLMLAAANGSSAVCEYLISRAADINLVDSKGRDALWFSRFYKHPEVTKLLEQALWKSSLNHGIIVSLQPTEPSCPIYAEPRFSCFSSEPQSPYPISMSQSQSPSPMPQCPNLDGLTKLAGGRVCREVAEVHREDSGREEGGFYEGGHLGLTSDDRRGILRDEDSFHGVRQSDVEDSEVCSAGSSFREREYEAFFHKERQITSRYETVDTRFEARDTTSVEHTALSHEIASDESCAVTEDKNRKFSEDSDQIRKDYGTLKYNHQWLKRQLNTFLHKMTEVRAGLNYNNSNFEKRGLDEERAPGKGSDLGERRGLDEGHVNQDNAELEIHDNVGIEFDIDSFMDKESVRDSHESNTLNAQHGNDINDGNNADVLNANIHPEAITTSKIGAIDQGDMGRPCINLGELTWKLLDLEKHLEFLIMFDSESLLDIKSYSNVNCDVLPSVVNVVSSSHQEWRNEGIFIEENESKAAASDGTIDTNQSIEMTDNMKYRDQNQTAGCKITEGDLNERILYAKEQGRGNEVNSKEFSEMGVCDSVTMETYDRDKRIDIMGETGDSSVSIERLKRDLEMLEKENEEMRLEMSEMRDLMRSAEDLKQENDLLIGDYKRFKETVREREREDEREITEMLRERDEEIRRLREETEQLRERRLIERDEIGDLRGTRNGDLYRARSADDLSRNDWKDSNHFILKENKLWKDLTWHPGIGGNLVDDSQSSLSIPVTLESNDCCTATSALEANVAETFDKVSKQNLDQNSSTFVSVREVRSIFENMSSRNEQLSNFLANRSKTEKSSDFANRSLSESVNNKKKEAWLNSCDSCQSNKGGASKKLQHNYCHCIKHQNKRKDVEKSAEYASDGQSTNLKNSIRSKSNTQSADKYAANDKRANKQKEIEHDVKPHAIGGPDQAERNSTTEVVEYQSQLINNTEHKDDQRQKSVVQDPGFLVQKRVSMVENVGSLAKNERPMVKKRLSLAVGGGSRAVGDLRKENSSEPMAKIDFKKENSILRSQVRELKEEVEGLKRALREQSVYLSWRRSLERNNGGKRWEPGVTQSNKKDLEHSTKSSPGTIQDSYSQWNCYHVTGSKGMLYRSCSTPDVKCCDEDLMMMMKGKQTCDSGYHTLVRDELNLVNMCPEEIDCLDLPTATSSVMPDQSNVWLFKQGDMSPQYREYRLNYRTKDLDDPDTRAQKTGYDLDEAMYLDERYVDKLSDRMVNDEAQLIRYSENLKVEVYELKRALCKCVERNKILMNSLRGMTNLTGRVIQALGVVTTSLEQGQALNYEGPGLAYGGRGLDYVDQGEDQSFIEGQNIDLSNVEVYLGQRWSQLQDQLAKIEGLRQKSFQEGLNAIQRTDEGGKRVQRSSVAGMDEGDEEIARVIVRENELFHHKLEQAATSTVKLQERLVRTEEDLEQMRIINEDLLLKCLELEKREVTQRAEVEQELQDEREVNKIQAEFVEELKRRCLEQEQELSRLENILELERIKNFKQDDARENTQTVFESLEVKNNQRDSYNSPSTNNEDFYTEGPGTSMADKLEDRNIRSMYPTRQSFPDLKNTSRDFTEVSASNKEINQLVKSTRGCRIRRARAVLDQQLNNDMVGQDETSAYTDIVGQDETSAYTNIVGQGEISAYTNIVGQDETNTCDIVAKDEISLEEPDGPRSYGIDGKGIGEKMTGDIGLSEEGYSSSRCRSASLPVLTRMISTEKSPSSYTSRRGTQSSLTIIPERHPTEIIGERHLEIDSTASLQELRAPGANYNRTWIKEWSEHLHEVDINENLGDMESPHSGQCEEGAVFHPDLKNEDLKRFGDLKIEEMRDNSERFRQMNGDVEKSSSDPPRELVERLRDENLKLRLFVSALEHRLHAGGGATCQSSSLQPEGGVTLTCQSNSPRPEDGVAPTSGYLFNGYITAGPTYPVASEVEVIDAGGLSSMVSLEHEIGDTALTFVEVSPIVQPSTEFESSTNFEVEDGKKRKKLSRGGALQECPFCQKRIRKLVEHMRIHTGETPYPCEYCDKSFSRRESLTIHTRYHTNERPFTCSQCGKGFASNTMRRTHEKSHTTMLTSVCSVCGKAYANASNLKRHMMTHSGDIKRFGCEHCDKRFNTRPELSSHSAMHTDARPYPCSQCSLTFKRVQDRYRHIFSVHRHNNEKPFQCEVCNKRFRRAGHLKDHAVVHTDTKSFQCVSCSAWFRYRSALYAHIRRKHGGEVNVFDLHKPQRSQHRRLRWASTDVKVKSLDDNEVKVKSVVKVNAVQNTVRSGIRSGLDNQVKNESEDRFEVKSEVVLGEGEMGEMLEGFWGADDEAGVYCGDDILVKCGEQLIEAPLIDNAIACGEDIGHVSGSQRPDVTGSTEYGSQRPYYLTRSAENKAGMVSSRVEKTEMEQCGEAVDNDVNNQYDDDDVVNDDYNGDEATEILTNKSSQQKLRELEGMGSREEKEKLRKFLVLMEGVLERGVLLTGEFEGVPEGKRLEVGEALRGCLRESVGLAFWSCSDEQKKEWWSARYKSGAREKQCSADDNADDNDDDDEDENSLTGEIIGSGGQQRNDTLATDKGHESLNLGQEGSNVGQEESNLGRGCRRKQIKASVRGLLVRERQRGQKSERGKQRVIGEGTSTHTTNGTVNRTDTDTEGRMNSDTGKLTNSKTDSKTDTKRQCYVCRRFVSKLSHHMKIHFGEFPYQCSLCPRKFRHKESMQTHIRYHSDSLSHPCSSCDRRFDSADKLTEHEALAHNPVTHQHVCHQCGRAYTSSLALQRHVDVKHVPDKLKQHQCSVCLRAFHTAVELKRHTRTHSESPMFTCHHCGLKVRAQKTLERHILNTHVNNNTTETASHSEDVTSKIISSVTHSADGDGSINQTLTHSTDDTGVLENSDLNNCTDQNITDVMNEICSGIQDSLTESNTILNPTTGISYIISENSVSEKTQRGKKKKKGGSFDCGECGKHFAHMSRLREHVVSHSNERPFMCSICAKTFRYKSNLTAHIITLHPQAIMEDGRIAA